MVGALVRTVGSVSTTPFQRAIHARRRPTPGARCDPQIPPKADRKLRFLGHWCFSTAHRLRPCHPSVLSTKEKDTKTEAPEHCKVLRAFKSKGKEEGRIFAGSVPTAHNRSASYIPAPKRGEACISAEVRKYCTEYWFVWRGRTCSRPIHLMAIRVM
ncbi:hypothetical protein VTG60DRAFT_4192 [Thermothelomyces hinnuleus]